MSLFQEIQCAPRLRQIGNLLSLLLVAGVVCVSAFFGVRMDGDGSEYFLTSAAIYKHGSTHISPQDFSEVAHEPLYRTAGLPVGLLGQVPSALKSGKTIFMGFAVGKDGKISAIHFWLYSAIASLFCFAAAVFSLSPAYGFAACNTFIALSCLYFLRSWFPRRFPAVVCLFFCSSVLVYLRWTGPEVLTACCVLLSAASLLRRDYFLATCFSGLAATQNPSAAALIPATMAYWLLLRFRPGLAINPVHSRPVSVNVAFAIAGIFFAALPYIYSYDNFGSLSIIAKFYTLPELVSIDRFLSFWLDLNQGVMVGLIGVLVLVVFLLCRLDPSIQGTYVIHMGLALLLSIVMIVPTLGATNWNSGYMIFLRYGSWAIMPIVAVALAVTQSVKSQGLSRIICICVLVQCFVAWESRWPRGAYLESTRLANFVLNHHPSLYNPDPEIFLERELREERIFTSADVAIHYFGNSATKLIKHDLKTDWEGVPICLVGEEVIAESTSRSSSGWRYFNGPFSCGKPSFTSQKWAFNGPEPLPFLQEGWSQPEAGGVWSDGSVSKLVVQGLRQAPIQSLVLIGRYLRPSDKTRVVINGVDYGRFVLTRQRIDLSPMILPRKGTLEILLYHDRPLSPHELGISSDMRKLGFFLEKMEILSAAR